MFRISAFVGLFIMLTFCFTTTFADNNPPMPGSYSEASVSDSAVQVAANFAVQQINQGTLVKVISAQSQVVAGLNYKMQLQIVDSQGKQTMYSVVVFVPLPYTQAPMQLTSAELMSNGATISNTP